MGGCAAIYIDIGMVACMCVGSGIGVCSGAVIFNGIAIVFECGSYYGYRFCVCCCLKLAILLVILLLTLLLVLSLLELLY